MSLLRARFCSLSQSYLLPLFLGSQLLPGSSLPRGPTSPSALTADCELALPLVQRAGPWVLVGGVFSHLCSSQAFPHLCLC